MYRVYSYSIDNKTVIIFRGFARKKKGRKGILNPTNRKFMFFQHHGEKETLKRESLPGNRVSQLVKYCVISGLETDSPFPCP